MYGKFGAPTDLVADRPDRLDTLARHRRTARPVRRRFHQYDSLAEKRRGAEQRVVLDDQNRLAAAGDRLGLSGSLEKVLDAAIRESTHRVARAMVNSGFNRPNDRIVVNLAPAALRKEGSGFDLAIALSILAASGQVPAPTAPRWCKMAGGRHPVLDDPAGAAHSLPSREIA